jgi:hypothetical protein
MTLVHVPAQGRTRKSAEDIVGLYRQRQQAKGMNHEQMRDILNLYQGDIAVPLPEMRREEKPSIVNLAKQGINQMGMRTASVMPNIEYPPINMGRSEEAEKNADKRRKINMSWWDEVGQQIKLRQRARWMFAYAHAPVLVCPDYKMGRPGWKPISPLNTFPSHIGAFDDMVPTDCIVVATHSVGYCKKMWPRSELVLMDLKDDALCEILHYIDEYEYHTVVTPRLLTDEVRAGNWFGNRALAAATLDWSANLTGRPWVVIPRAISLEGPVGLYDSMVGMYEAQAELDALGKIARRKGVFAEEWLVADSFNVTPQIVTMANPYNGVVGIVQGGKIDRLSPDVMYSTDTGVDRLERAQRIEAGLPSDFGGESSTNVRTGARATALIASAVDPILQEAHELFARSLEHENHIAIAIDKSYWSGSSKTVWLGSEAVKYDPGKVWETDRHRVSYSMAGADLNQMTIVPLQMVGAGLMSPETAMGYHPLIVDVEREMDRIMVGRLDNAIVAGIEQLLATPGGMPIGDAVRMRKMIASNKADIAEAYEQVQLEAQERQAKLAETQAQAMPGMEMPGQGAEQPSMIAPPTDAMGNLRNVLGNLRMQQMTTPQERGVA